MKNPKIHMAFVQPEGYPHDFEFYGKRYRFSEESHWQRQFVAEDGHELAVSRLMDGSFDPAVFSSINPGELSRTEAQVAGMVLSMTDLEEVPNEWKRLVTEFQEQMKQWEKEWEASEKSTPHAKCEVPQKA